MPYLRKSDSAAYDGVASEWAIKLGLYCARASITPISYDAEPNGKDIIAETNGPIGECDINILFEPKFVGLRHHLSWEGLESMIGEWRLFCSGYVMGKITQKGLIITGHNATARGVLAARKGLNRTPLTDSEIRKLHGLPVAPELATTA